MIGINLHRATCLARVVCLQAILGLNAVLLYLSLTSLGTPAQPGSWLRKTSATNVLYSALSQAYPDHPWRVWRFKAVPNGYWLDSKNCRKFFEDVGQELGVKQMEDWYTVLAEDVEHCGGTTVLRSLFQGSLPKALISLFPEHNWDTTEFRNSPAGALRRLRSVVQSIEIRLNIKAREDWYHVTDNDVRFTAGGAFVREHDGEKICAEYCCGRPISGRAAIEKFDNLPTMLQKVYPEHFWELWRFSFRSSALDPHDTEPVSR